MAVRVRIQREPRKGIGSKEARTNSSSGLSKTKPGGCQVPPAAQMALLPLPDAIKALRCTDGGIG
jgi:hypothetical protein